MRVGAGVGVEVAVGDLVTVAVAAGSFRSAVGEAVGVKARSVATAVGLMGSASVSPAQDPNIAMMSKKSNARRNITPPDGSVIRYARGHGYEA